MKKHIMIIVYLLTRLTGKADEVIKENNRQIENFYFYFGVKQVRLQFIFHKK
jgi:hypothetical protein